MQRVVIITVVLLIVAGIAFYVVANAVGERLKDAPHIASVKDELRALVAAQDSFYQRTATYATELADVWRPRAENPGVELRLVQADSLGFIAEGKHDSWAGRCVVAVGRGAGDSLKVGEPVCRSE